jgi:hypothetical protein
MISGYTFGLIKLVGTFGILLAFCAWQLWSLRRDRLEMERKAAEEEAKRPPPEPSLQPPGRPVRRAS